MQKLPQGDASSFLDFFSDRGEIFLRDYRMVLHSACALGAMRKELIETLGWERTRGVLKRFGYAAGLADARALAARFPAASAEDHMALGPWLHALEGVAAVERIPERCRIDLDAGVYHVEAYWLNSYEAEQHLSLFGPAQEPVCWSLAGYARGHSTVAAGRPTFVVERECRAMGHTRCRFEACFEPRDAAVAEQERQDYQHLRLPAVLQDMTDTLDQQRSVLADREQRIVDLERRLGAMATFEGLVGESHAFCQAVDLARQVAPVDSTVLVLGESGTGKELMARALHQRSRRKHNVFLPVNCSVLPPSMQEAELFGYLKGAFTGAHQARAGVFESADGGTLFLDEIGDLSPSAQTQILRALQEGEIKRLGDDKWRKVDVRIIAATHRDLAQMVAEKTFREDLFYRLEVITLVCPPLRERGNDIFLLADHFLHQFAKRFDKPIRALDSGAQRALGQYRWPGNVRELSHAIERAVILSQGPLITRADLPEKVQAAPASQSAAALSPAPAGDLGRARRQLASIDDERERILLALQLAGGHRDRAATLLEMGRTTLWRRMKDLGIPMRAVGRPRGRSSASDWQ